MIDTSSKYKFLWKLALEDVEVVKSKAPFADPADVFFFSYGSRDRV